MANAVSLEPFFTATLLSRHFSTNATISYSNNNATASLELGGETLQVQILSPAGAGFTTLQPVPFSDDPAVPSGEINQNLPNPGVSVLTIELAEGDQNIQVSLK